MPYFHLPNVGTKRLIERLAKESRWLVRKGRKLDPGIFVQALVASVGSGYFSLRQIATEVGLLTGSTISRPSLHDRMNGPLVRFLKQLVANQLSLAIGSVEPFSCRHLEGVERVLVGDSSVLTLNESLMSEFPGSSNQHGVNTAQCRLQLTFDLLGGCWVDAKLDSYKRNDRIAASDIVASVVKRGDLIIRDLGYAVIGCFKAIEEKGAYFLSRLQRATIFDLDGDQIDLFQLVRAKASVSGDRFTTSILLGEKQRFQCRLIAIRVPQNVADQRRRRLHREGKRQGVKHSDSYLKLQDWTILVTNLREDQTSEEQLYHLYRMRWRIENVFRLAKSQTHLPRIAKHRTNRYHLEALLYAWMLLMIGLSREKYFRLLETAEENGVIQASVFKAIERVIQWTVLEIELSGARTIRRLKERWINQHAYHDRYENRLRISLPERLSLVLSASHSKVLT